MRWQRKPQQSFFNGGALKFYGELEASGPVGLHFNKNSLAGQRLV